MPPPPPPPPPPMPALAAPVKKGGPAPPPPPPPSMATGAIPRRAPPPPPPAAKRAPPPPPPPPAAPRAPPKPAGRPPQAQRPRPPTPPRRKAPAALNRLPSKAPALPATPRASDMDENIDASKFPSFTMDTSFELTDISNTKALQDLPVTRSSFGTSKRNSVGFTLDSDDTSLPRLPQQLPKGKSGTPWKKPLDPTSIPADAEDDEGCGLDVPDRLTVGPGAAAARLDLQRCTIRVHKQLVNTLKTNSMAAPPKVNTDQNSEEMSRCQGELWLKSRIPMRGWKKRYGSIVDHAYFGPVLFLFKYDAKGNVALHHSMMIVLVDSDVRLGKNTTTKDHGYRCEFELRTTKRKYTVAANHTMRRDYWLRNLESIQRQASTVR